MEPGRPQMTIWRMRIAYWIPKATKTPRICNAYWFSAATMVPQKRLIVKLHVQYLSCVCFVWISEQTAIISLYSIN